jgi:nitrile hydratase accessory protein
VSDTLLDVEGRAAPPRSNGELVFAEPWESRAFGMAITLHAGGVFEWEDFRRELIAAIAAWEASHEPVEEYSYYRCWLAALERVLAGEGLVEPGVLERRATELAARPAGNDHGH